LEVNNSQFQKVVITQPRGKRTHRKKIKHGVLTVYFHNKKLRDVLIKELQKLGLNN